MKAKMGTVDIIIPTYNRLAFLREAIASILEQTYQDFRIIVCDDGSTDNTASDIVKLDSRITVISSQHSGLSAKVRNIGINSSNNQFIAFLDSDDLWTPSNLEEKMDIFSKHPDVCFVYSNYFTYQNNIQDAIPYPPRLIPCKGNMLKVFLKIKGGVCTPSVIVKRSLIDKTGVFNEDPDFKVAQDYDLWLRIASQTTCYYIDKPLVYVRRHATNTTLNRTIQTQKAKLKALRNLNEICNIPNYHFRYAKANLYFFYAKDYVQKRCYFSALRWFLTCLLYNPKLIKAILQLITGKRE